MKVSAWVALFAATTKGTAFASDFKAIASEEEFTSKIVGQKILCGEDDHYTIRRNGRLSGRFGGESLKGAWEWRDGYFCRTLTTVRPGTDCQLFEIRGSEVRGTRARGKGNSFVCRLK